MKKRKEDKTVEGNYDHKKTGAKFHQNKRQFKNELLKWH